MSLPKPINWIRGGSTSNDLLMTYSEIRAYDNENRRYTEDTEYSQIMSPNEVKDFLSNLANAWLDSLELTTISVEVIDSDGTMVNEEQQRLVPQWNNGEVAMQFKGLDSNSSDDDDGFRLGRLMPDTDLEEVRNEILETIDEYLTSPIQVNYIAIYVSDSTIKVLFRPLNPKNLDEMFGLE